MKLHHHINEKLNVIRGYTDTSVTINDEQFTRSIVIQPEQLMRDWSPRTVDELDPTSIQSLAKLNTEIILLGTGNKQAFPDQRLLIPCYDRGIGVEIMDTPAACRTYNLLLEEGRAVTAALIIG